jgi:hypothetical protein
MSHPHTSFEQIGLVRPVGEKERQVPTSLIESISRLKSGQFLFTYLDGTSFQGSLLTDPVLFRTAPLLAQSTVREFKASSIAQIQGDIDGSEGSELSPRDLIDKLRGGS